MTTCHQKMPMPILIHHSDYSETLSLDFRYNLSNTDKQMVTYLSHNYVNNIVKHISLTIYRRWALIGTAIITLLHAISDLWQRCTMSIIR